MALPDVNMLIEQGKVRDTEIVFVKYFAPHKIGDKKVTFMEVAYALKDIGVADLVEEPIKVEVVEEPKEIEEVKVKPKSVKKVKKGKGE